MSYLLSPHPPMALCGLPLILFHGTIRYICFSASDRLDFHLRIHHLQKGCLYLPSILAGLYYSLSACLHSWCQVLTDASSFPLSTASHFSVFLSFLFFFFCLIIICPEWALSEGGLFVLQPGSQLFSGSAVFFSSPSVQLEYPREIWLCLWYLFFVLLTSFWGFFCSYANRWGNCHLFWCLIVS